MQLIFDKSVPGRKTSQLPKLDVPAKSLEELTGGCLRAEAPDFPELSELDVIRHFQELARNNVGVDDSFYPLGSCTMKYNPKISERAARLPVSSNLHPEVEVKRAQGVLKIIKHSEELYSEILGMADFTLHPMAGAHGELVGMNIIRAYHNSRGDTARTRVLTPDSSHGTNPASAAMAGFTVEAIKTNDAGEVDIEDLKSKLGPDVAGIMLTNPNTLGIFETQILKIAKLVHDAGGLLYYDGANLNAILGQCRPGDMGFDVVHINLHKTFATPHGGGGPGSGPVGVCEKLVKFLPTPRIVTNEDGLLGWDNDFPESIGRVSEYYGNVGVVVRAYAYILSLGAEGLKQVSRDAVLAANYLRVSLKDKFPTAHDRICMHEFVATPGALLDKGVRTLDIAKALIQNGVHPMTIYFPLVVPEAMMIEPTETESLETLDNFINLMNDIANRADADPDWIHSMPTNTPVGRLDEAQAARAAKVIHEQT